MRLPRCGCDFHKQPSHLGDPAGIYCLKATHQVFAGVYNGVSGTLTLGWAPRIKPEYSDEDPRLERAAAQGEVLGAASAMVLTAGAAGAGAMRIPALARVAPPVAPRASV